MFASMQSNSFRVVLSLALIVSFLAPGRPAAQPGIPAQPAIAGSDAAATHGADVGGSSSPAALTADHTITLTPAGFDPPVITVTVGAQVAWIDATGQDHTLQSGVPGQQFLPIISRNDSMAGADSPKTTVAPFAPAGEEFGGVLVANGSLNHIFTSAGAHPYYAADMPHWRGAVVVRSAFPPDPAAVAPPLDPGMATDFAAATAFLYTGADPIQTGVALGAIAPVRAAVVRGRVIDRAGAALSAVRVAVLNHPELGQTLSRGDGRFDLAVNGGGRLTLTYEKSGYLPAQRAVDAPWRDYVIAEDQALIPPDPHVTVINLAANTPIQTAQGSEISDADGNRRETIFFRAGTQGTMTMPDGSTQPLPSVIHVRATEYTVGERGPAAMPGDLPPVSQYTYAAEFSVDEAVNAGALQVNFAPPVVSYNENFLGFPVGVNVPAGFYDRIQGLWLPGENGRVVKILSVTAGLADLDIDGSNTPASPQELAALGVAAAERQQLAIMYPVGATLWRTPLAHFSPWDKNFGWGPPPDAQPPNVGSPHSDGPPPDGCEKDGSVIHCQTQVLGQVVGLVGAPFALHYASSRTPGRTAANSLDIELSGATLPASLKRIDLEIIVAGRIFTQTFPAAPQQFYHFVWDGQDAYGRRLQGRQSAIVDIAYVYDGVYQAVERFGYNGNGVPITASVTRREVMLHQVWETSIGAWDARDVGLGGWTLGVHHVYDPHGHTLYQGDGAERSAPGVNAIVTTVAGGGVSLGDGGQATNANLAHPNGVAVSPDGSFYIADTEHHRIRRVAADGVITTVAGDGQPCNDLAAPCGDGGQATQAQLFNPTRVRIGRDGSLYIDSHARPRIRKIAPNGVITTVAGGRLCSGAPCGDGGPAVDAGFEQSINPLPAPDGSLYISDYWAGRVRKVDPNGIITTVAGGAGSCPDPALPCGDGGPATQAQLNRPWDLGVAADGSLYIADTGIHRIRRVGPDGIITTVAGGGNPQVGDGDGGPADHARLSLAAFNELGGMATTNDGLRYIGEPGRGRIREVGPDGIIRTIAGNGVCCKPYTGEGGPATAAQLDFPHGLSASPDGSLYVVDANKVLRVRPLMPDFTAAAITVASEDGSQLFQFDSQGRHLRTVHGLTGATLFQFSYDSAGRLARVTDGDGNVTHIEHDSAGQPTAIISPYGQRTTLQVDGNGYLSRVTDPANQATRMSYSAQGLLLTFTDPNNRMHTMGYDAAGRLLKDSDPAGGFSALARATSSGSYTVTLTTALGRPSVYGVVRGGAGDWRQANSGWDGLSIVTQVGMDDSRQTRSTDGVISTESFAPDPRWGAMSPVPAQHTIHTPGGLTLTVTTARTAALADPANPLSLTTLSEQMNVNGRAYTSVYDVAAATFKQTTPAGRQQTLTVDAQGRPTIAQVAGLAPTTFTYDNRRRLSAANMGSGADARLTAFAYNSAGFLATLSDPLGRNVGFSYDAAGHVVQETRPDGRVIGFGYDANGNLTSLTPPGRSAHFFTYTPVDLVATYAAPAVGGVNSITTYEYNLDRQLTRVTRADGQQISYSYDGAGRLQTLTTPGGVYTYTYDPATDQLASVAGPGGSLAYQHDGFLPTQFTWSGAVAGAVSLAFDNDFRLSTQRVNGAVPITFTYDSDSLLASAGGLTFTRNGQHGLLTGSALGGVTDSYSYNGFGEVTHYTAKFNNTTLLDVQTGYDKLGRIIQKSESIGGGGTNVYNYVYDLAGRLVEAKKDNVSVGAYTYDSNGNRLSYGGVHGPANGVYDAQDRLTQYGGGTYTYSADGELQSKTVSGQSTQYSYDVLGNLRAVTLPVGTQIEYVHDGQDRRIGKKVNGALVQGFLYEDQLRIVAELDGAGNVVSRFVYGNRDNVPDYMIKAGVTYRLITDHLGSVRLVVNTASGALAQRIDYDEFGVTLNDTNPGFQPFGYAGGLYDAQTGLVRFGARDYDAKIGRWTTKDPIFFEGDQVNLYLYVGNDPLNWMDMSGLGPIGPGVEPKFSVTPFDETKLVVDTNGVKLQVKLKVLLLTLGGWEWGWGWPKKTPPDSKGSGGGRGGGGSSGIDDGGRGSDGKGGNAKKPARPSPVPKCQIKLYGWVQKNECRCPVGGSAGSAGSGAFGSSGSRVSTSVSGVILPK